MLPHQVCALGLHDLGAAEHPERGEDPAQNARHGGLARAGWAGEDQVAQWRLVRQTLFLAQPGHTELGHQGTYLFLDRFQTDHAVEFGHGLVQTGGLTESGHTGGEFGVGGLDVGRAHGDQVVGAGSGGRFVAAHPGGDHPHVPRLAALLHHGAGETAVAQLVHGLTLDGLVVAETQGSGGVGVQGVATGGDETLGDTEQFVRAVAGEGDARGETRGQTRVGGQERVHLLVIAGEHDDQAVPVVLRALEECLDRLVAESVGLAVAFVDQ